MVIRVKKERQFDLRTYDIVDTHKNMYTIDKVILHTPRIAQIIQEKKIPI